MNKYRVDKEKNKRKIHKKSGEIGPFTPNNSQLVTIVIKI